MARSGTLVVRLISSPGSGKTMLLEKTAEALSEAYKIAVLVGDVETDRDAQRLAPIVPTVQMTTGEECHVEFPLLEGALTQLNQPDLDILFVEDIGNLICAPSHDLGEHLRVLLLSTTEGDDKPGKFPKAFRTSDVLLITKTDLLPYVSFQIKRVAQDARRIQPGMKILTLSAHTNEGLVTWYEYLRREHRRLLAARANVTPRYDRASNSSSSRIRAAQSKSSIFTIKNGKTKKG
jgi:hydrogenase nickel incorporation protein HypB